MLGLTPTQPWHFIALAVPLAAWLLTRNVAEKQQLTIMYNSSLAVSYWEEFLFRGLVFGAILFLIPNAIVAVVGSSLLFGVFHLRNLWCMPRRAVVVQCLYAGLAFGLIAGWLRWWSGDIYLGVALHGINNFASLSLPGNAPKLTDAILLSKRQNMNRFQYLFSGFWLLRGAKPFI